MSQANKAAKRFSQVVWLGIAANLFFAIPALLLPTALSTALGIAPLEQTAWLQNAGMLLIGLCAVYAVVAVDPIRYQPFSWLAVLIRFWAAGVWLLLMACSSAGGRLWPLLTKDLTLGVVLLVFLNRAVCEANQMGRRPWKRSIVSRLAAVVFTPINYVVPWHRLAKVPGIGKWLSLANLYVLREDLREYNLHDNTQLSSNEQPAKPWDDSTSRSPDGTSTDPTDSGMGRVGCRFGRNFDLDSAWPQGEPEILQPSPREISRKLMTRDEFIPAPWLNLLAASWIQFQNHGWFNHMKVSDAPFNAKPWDQHPSFKIPLREDDQWPADQLPDQPRMDPMVIPKTPLDPTRPEGSQGSPTFINTESHWWDASQIYGSNRERQMKLRTGVGGGLIIGEDRLLPVIPEDEEPQLKGGIDRTGFHDNWWVGLSMLHALFTLEHNKICEHLREEFPSRKEDDEWLFQKARLINAALIAKIHTVEWTPSILNTPEIDTGLNANWRGLFGDPPGKKAIDGKTGRSEAFFGIPGTATEHHTAPYYLTEEFVAVYRLHPLIPDEVEVHSAKDGSVLHGYEFTQVQGVHTRSVMNAHSLVDWWYTFGVLHPGAITLHNFPRTLQHFVRTNGQVLDLAAVDIMRDRERGVRRYNDFRRGLRMKPAKTFNELTDNPRWARELEELYEGDIEKVDLMVGMLAEPLPDGFGFSDTAFRIFILMASRRLKSDRFFTTDYTPRVYTEFGLRWIDDRTMSTVLIDHFPELKPFLKGKKSAFFPWNQAGNAG